MPADPVMRARARLFLFNFERELSCARPDHRKYEQPEGDREGKLLIGTR